MSSILNSIKYIRKSLRENDNRFHRNLHRWVSTDTPNYVTIENEKMISRTMDPSQVIHDNKIVVTVVMVVEPVLYNYIK